MHATLEQAARRFGRAARLASEYPGAQRVPLEYPGRRPPTSFIYIDGVVLPVVPSAFPSSLSVDEGHGPKRDMDSFLSAHGSLPLAERFSVLAVGSNACPGRLQEKFEGQDRDPVVVIKGWIADVDSIYTSWLADYGALPATVTNAPGTEVEIWATLLTSNQLEIMNHSERLGDDYLLVSVASTFRAGPIQIENVYAYFDRRALLLDGERVRVADFMARNTKHRALTEREVLEAVLDRLQFRAGESIEQRHQALTHARATINDLNVRLARWHMGRNDCEHALSPVQTRELQTLQWSSR